MSGSGTSVGAGAFRKHYPTVAAATAALTRAMVLAKAGVATPAILERVGPRCLAFERVEAAGQASLGGMVGLLGRLHAAPMAGLVRFDPFRRIHPRLAQASSRVGRLVEDLVARDAGLDWPGSRAIHGDFHPGQVMCDGAGKLWLVDLDDMAAGPPEADLGNLAAWLATQEAGRLDAVAQEALARVLELAPGSDPALAAHFCQIAVIRRALKLAGRGEPWALEQVVQWPCGREMSYFSIR